MAANPDSILDSVKKVLGFEAEYTVFDLDIAMFINSAIGALNQMGVGPATGLFVQDNSTLWAEITTENNLLGLVQTYTYIKCRLLFDPPATAIAIKAVEAQIEELGWRVNQAAETINPPGSPRHLHKHNPYGEEDSYRELALELALDFNLER
jgi:hypothetical protein